MSDSESEYNPPFAQDTEVIEKFSLNNSEWMRFRLTGQLPDRVEPILEQIFKDQSNPPKRQKKSPSELPSSEQDHEIIHQLAGKIKEILIETGPQHAVELKQLGVLLSRDGLVADEAYRTMVSQVPFNQISDSAFIVLLDPLITLLDNKTRKTGMKMYSLLNFPKHVKKLIESHEQALKNAVNEGYDIDKVRNHFVNAFLHDEEELLRGYPSHDNALDIVETIDELYSYNPPQEPTPELVKLITTMYKRKVIAYRFQEREIGKSFKRLAQKANITLPQINNLREIYNEIDEEDFE